MVSSEQPPSSLKRSSSLLDQPDFTDTKRPKRPYHHHHSLHTPVVQTLPEPAITDDATVDHLMDRSIGLYLRECGFDIADPAALDSFRNATGEYILRFASFIRQAMLVSRRTQPIPQDFEHALLRHRLRLDDLIPHLKSPSSIDPIPTLPLTPPPVDAPFKTLPSLGPQLSGETDRAHRAYIPTHFPEFPSKHTYRHTAVFTEREQDPQRIRERATEDGRHGEEALRKLARAAFTDTQAGTSSRDKKPWGRRTETMDSMFEKTVRSLAKKMQNAPPTAPMEIEFGAAADPEVKPGRNKLALNIDLPPIINCERDFWRRSGGTRRESKPAPKEATPEMSRVEGWIAG
ncbi:bromodomain associated domain protein [Aspergillus campestris IBT 28561]|uniref:Transcription initiation factor TFIID subunit 8 n=1 Tax=Aspergillus campestris (strain IBT 28561) TaxID=1392248 RepID=A0A2I1CT18_ASPC2|nr:bromodomain associated domain protein [Aspergillus campestris IBT 28561]PKY00759.1 bromodomain associated domain protein [Aspergillus campestris IBT 28561]